MVGRRSRLTIQNQSILRRECSRIPDTPAYAYDARGDFGLRVPTLSVLLPVLLLCTILFALACLPVVAAWRGSRYGLFLWLGVTLFFLVGLQSQLIAVWLPLELRVPHTLEILADELAYAAVLAWLSHSEPTGGRQTAPT